MRKGLDVKLIFLKKQLKKEKAMTTKERLKPIVNDDSEILILGSLPGDKTLKDNEKIEENDGCNTPKYYCNPNNRFWKIIASLQNQKGKASFSDAEKSDLLKLTRIALWDVCKAANRENSDDKNIKNATFDYESIKNFIQNNPNIKTIAFNGKKASKIFSKKYQEKMKTELFPRQINFLPYLPSSSGLNREKLDRLIDDWKEILYQSKG